MDSISRGDVELPGRYRTMQLDLPVAARQRQAVVCIPAAPPPPAGWPLVLAFHGGQSHPEMMRRFSGLDVLAAEGRAVVAYPAGTGSRDGLFTWNGGNCCGEARDTGSDDVGFVRALVADIARRMPIDARRVHATGMSNGAMMCYRLAAELSDKIAAIAPVAGTMAIPEAKPRRPVPVIHFHGTDDSMVGYEGPGGKVPDGMTFKSVDQSVRTWALLNGCPEQAMTTTVPDTNRDDDCTVECSVYGPGKDGAEVVLYTIRGGGHTWPGRKAARFLGASTLDIDASTLIWEFFQRHPKE